MLIAVAIAKCQGPAGDAVSGRVGLLNSLATLRLDSDQTVQVGPVSFGIHASEEVRILICPHAQGLDPVMATSQSCVNSEEASPDKSDERILIAAQLLSCTCLGDLPGLILSSGPPPTKVRKRRRYIAGTRRVRGGYAAGMDMDQHSVQTGPTVV